MTYYVDASACVPGDGSKDRPFTRINDAAKIAVAGDEIIVAPGIYREYVNPVNGGTENARITYRSAKPLGAIITGAEEVKSWELYQGNVWKAEIDNSLFGDFNPYLKRVEGDWFIATIVAHLGDVYLNHKSLYEVLSIEETLEPKSQSLWDPGFSDRVWYTEQSSDGTKTLLYANFGGINPNEAEVEISVRQNCFLPKEEGRGFITLSGFVVREAASQWAPPTAYQDGMIGPHWSKGWIIEDCEIYEAKCSGISLGKYLQPNNDNKWLHKKYKDGTQTERDCICQASYEGWDKEHIGSHIIRRCTIHDCGQTGIVGHLGGVFSIIEDNHIYNINNKQNLAGAEIGGIKMHAAIDVIYRRNRIHHCTRGIWLDWQAQGTRVTQNLLYDNTLPFDLNNLDMSDPMTVFGGMGEDIFVEVSHGPTLIDNNILLSNRSIKFATQGIALVHNFIAGSLTCVGAGTDNGTPDGPSPRYTPYHAIHGTAVMGFMTFLHGDNRFYNNIFVQQPIHPIFKGMQDSYRANPAMTNGWDTNNFEAGTFDFDDYPTFEEWDAMFDGYCGMGSAPSNRYYTHLPIWAGGNLYLNGAKNWKKETDFKRVDDAKITFSIQENDEGVFLASNLFEKFEALSDGLDCKLICTETLGMAFEPEEYYENPDGTPITFDKDFFGQKRSTQIFAGPFADLSTKTANLRVF